MASASAAAVLEMLRAPRLLAESAHATTAKPRLMRDRTQVAAYVDGSFKASHHGGRRRFVVAKASAMAAEMELFENCQVPRRKLMALIASNIISQQIRSDGVVLALPSTVFREHLDVFDGYTFKYPQGWIQVRGAGADIFFRDPYVLDENLSVEVSSPSSSRYKSVEDLGPPEVAGEKVLRQFLTEFMSTRLGVRRDSNILSTSSRVADDGKLYYQVEVNIKSFANNNELAVMPQDRVVRMEWDRRYLSVLGVENNRLYELRLQVPENVFSQEEEELRQVMDSFRVLKAVS